jgi:spermidine synthase
MSPEKKTAPSSHTTIVYTIFAASGAVALVYQMIWARWLGLIFGNTATSVSIVLGSFMLGLALGSHLVGRRLSKIANPIYLYAILEIGIGIFAICFPLITMMIEKLYTAMVSVETSFSITLVIRVCLAFALLAIPTTLMGATLPLLTDFFRRHPVFTHSWKVGVLYAMNTLGAALGTFTASFIMIEVLGVRSTMLVAAALNLLIGYLGLKLAKGTTLLPHDQRDESSTNPLINKTKALALGVLTASGAIALASEVLWTRTLEILIGNSTYAFAIIVVIYLVGIAIGSWLISLFVNRLKPLSMWLIGTQLAMGVWFLFSIWYFNVIGEELTGVNKLDFLPISVFLIIYLKASSILFPLAFLSGATFPLATKILDPHSQEAHGSLIALAYAWNTIGAVFGSLIAGFIIAVHFDFFQALYLLSFSYGLVALIALFYLTPLLSAQTVYTRLTSGILGLSTIGLIAFSLSYVNEDSRFVRRINNNNSQWYVAYHQPGLQGITTVLTSRQNANSHLLLINGIGMTVKVTDTKMMAHLPMLSHPNPQNTLVICFGMGTTYRSAISYGNKVTVVELVKEVLNAFDYFFDDAPAVRNYPKGRMVINDGRNFLKLSKEKYDVITIDPPPPVDAAGVTNLYSREFLELARDHLTKGGIMAHWIPVPRSGGGVNDWETFSMLLATFAEIYPHRMLVHGWNKIGMHVLGSMEPFQGGGEYFKQRLASAPPAVLKDLNEWDQVPLEYFQPLVLEYNEHLRLNTDDRPFLEFNLLRMLRYGTMKDAQVIYW